MKKVLIIISSLVILTIVFLKCTHYMDKPTFCSSDYTTIYLNGISNSNSDDIIINNKKYISAQYLNQNNVLDTYWDKDQNIITIFNSYKVDKIYYNKKNVILNEILIDQNEILINNEKLYFNVDFLNSEFNQNIIYNDDTDSLFIDKNISNYIVLRNTKIRKKASYNSKPVKDLSIGDKIYGYDTEQKNWLLVRTKDYIIGYINKEVVTISSKKFETTYYSNNLCKKEKVILAWDLFYKKMKDFKEFEIPKALNVISPVWHKLNDNRNEKYFSDFSNEEYIQYVQNSDVQVWGTFNNSFDKDLTSKLLNNGEIRSEIINNIILISKEKGYEGINIDFENIYLEDKDVYSAFIKELYCKIKREGIIMSVDIAVMSNSPTWSRFFDRKVIGKYCDYAILMAYDENVNNIGSVSSIPWVEYGVENLLGYVSSEKIILGVPFYTRLWSTKEDNGVYTTDSSALKLTTAKERINKLNIELTYDEEKGQNYGEKVIDNIKYSIWNEDEVSLNNRLSIVSKYSLKGTAVWCLDYGNDDMWKLLNNYRN